MNTIVGSITEAKARLEGLLAAAEAGKEVIITRWGKPIVRMELTSAGGTAEEKR